MSASPRASQGLAILLWATDAQDPVRALTPFFHAAAAAAMGVNVEVHFSAASVRLLASGVAEQVRAAPEGITALDAMRMAHREGARYVACSAALAAHGLTPDQLIAECAGVSGAVAFMDRCLDPGWKTLVF